MNAHRELNYDAEEVADDYVPICRACYEPWPCPTASRTTVLCADMPSVEKVAYLQAMRTDEPRVGLRARIEALIDDDYFGAFVSVEDLRAALDAPDA